MNLAHWNYHDTSGFTQCSDLRPCFILFQLIVRVSSRKKNEARPRVTPNNPKSDHEPPPSTTSHAPRQTLRNAITLNTLYQRSEGVPRSEKRSLQCSDPLLFSCLPPRQTHPHRHIPNRRAPARTSKPGWREKHQYQQLQIYLVSCLLWTRLTTTARV